ncbi:cytochrome c [Ancylobacter sp. Lp-2]|uniref:c-type cytochrome n=1 Tax=Ancylobacter sp. Lp-2 TaxID=2881339 RepID=UPI001E5CD655|nr:cytochrome c [Ancylobacter sp. Lp-2]MCB4769635.1 cytochrome c [Ancylobacter sp. Lp-2]
MRRAFARAATIVAFVGLAFLRAGTATAQTGDPIAALQEAMGELSEAHKAASAMVKGHVPYDEQAAAAAMDSISAMAVKLPAMFPYGSESGEGTRASPAIWQNFADFSAYISRLQATASAAATAAPNGPAAFAPAYDALAATCKACHAAYRVNPAGEPDPLAAP